MYRIAVIYLLLILLTACIFSGDSKKNADKEETWLGKNNMNDSIGLTLKTPEEFLAGGFLSVSGNRIVNEKGEEVRLRGIQLGFGTGRRNWENIDENNTALRAFLDRILDYTVTQDDFGDLRAMGANATRFCLTSYKSFEIDAEPFTYRENNFKKLDRIITWAKQYNIYLIIGFMAVQGGQNTAEHSGNKGKNQLWHNPQYQQRLRALWKKIAQRYANEKIIAGYDLMNEPDAPDKTTLNKVYSDITKAIREVDNKHIIFLEGNLWAINLDWIHPPEDKNTAFSIHFYEPGFYATDGKGTYPSIIKSKAFDKAALRKELVERIEYARKLNRPVWVGEFGAPSKCGNYLLYVEDVINIFEEQNLSWSYYCYKNKKGISNTWELYYTSPENDFVRLARAIINGKSITAFSDTQLTIALESLKLSNFKAKLKLKKLLTKYLGGE